VILLLAIVLPPVTVLVTIVEMLIRPTIRHRNPRTVTVLRHILEGMGHTRQAMVSRVRVADDKW